MIRFEEFTGGALDTNCFLLNKSGQSLLIDAPQGADAHFANRKISALLLTHGHFDHVADAAAVRKRHGCPIYLHPETLPMVTDPNFFRNWGFALDVPPIDSAEFLTEGRDVEIAEMRFDVLEVPGHCPGSLCFYFPDEQSLFGGDVLFRGGLGRWDLPGGDYELLVRGIREKILPLPENTTVLPGHGPATTVGLEKSSNPWLA